MIATGRLKKAMCVPLIQCCIGLVFLSFTAFAKADKVLILGDSLSAAYGIQWQQGWVQLLEKELKSKHQIINASVSGESTGGGLSRLPALLKQHQPDWVIVELGGNDGLRGYPLSTIQKNLTSIGNLSVNASAKLIFLAVPIPENYGPRYTKEYFKQFPKAAAKFTAPTIPIYLEAIAKNPAKYIQADGIHPTAAAQPLIKDWAIKYILPIINGQ